MDTGRIRRVVAVAGALVAVVAFAGEKKGEPFTLVSVDDVEKMIGQPDVFVVDANPEDVYRKNHLPGAQWWRSKPLAQLLPAEKDRRLLFYCASPK
jgi:rhodanese-related sulfurtransferase